MLQLKTLLFLCHSVSPILLPVTSISSLASPVQYPSCAFRKGPLGPPQMCSAPSAFPHRAILLPPDVLVVLPWPCSSLKRLRTGQNILILLVQIVFWRIHELSIFQEFKGSKNWLRNTVLETRLYMNISFSCKAYQDKNSFLSLKIKDTSPLLQYKTT